MKRRLLGLLGVLVAAVASEFNDQVTAVALPDISGALGISYDTGTWFGSLYVTAEVIGMTLSPWLLVTFTLRQFTLYVLLLDATSSMLIPITPDASALLLLRLLQGLAGGLTIPLLMTTALRVLDAPIRLYGLAVYALTATFTPSLAPTLAALWTSVVGWQVVFLEAVPLCALAAVLAWYGLPQDPPAYDRLRIFDWRGLLLVVVGFGSLTTVLQQGDRLDWFDSPAISGLALASAVAIPLLLINEWFHPLPLLKLQLFGRANLAFGAIALFTFLIVGQSSSTIPDNLLQEVQGLRPEQYYFLTFGFAMTQLVLLPLVALLLDFRRVDARVVIFVGLGFILWACLSNSLLSGDWYRGQFVVSTAFQAVGQPMVVVSLLLLATSVVKGPDEAPFASALVNTPRALAEATALWLTQLIQRCRGGLHYSRIADQVGHDRWHDIGSPTAVPQLSSVVQQQARILTVSDTYLVFGVITAALMVVVLVLPKRVLPPRLQQ